MADQSKTEQPTQRRQQKARDDGNFPSARLFIGGVQFCLFTALLVSGGEAWLNGTAAAARILLKRAFEADLSVRILMSLAWELVARCLLPLLKGGAALAVASLAVQLAVTRMGFATSKLAPDITRLNPGSRLSSMPRQNMQAVLQAAVLLPVFGVLIYVIIHPRLEAFEMLPLASVGSGLQLVTSTLSSVLVKAAGIFFLIGCIDLIRENKRRSGELRMTKQEIRDEMKESEGDPQMKGRIRAIRRNLARQRMMKEVPTATAVVVNPTHFAVALRYIPESMVAPLVVAKGKNYLALRIRQIAVDNGVPLIENPPLAQALYKSVDVGQEIPPQLYKAVAELLAYIFKVMRRS